MTPDAIPERAPTVDVALAVQAAALPREHAHALREALCERLPWLAQDDLAGIHPLKCVQGTGDMALLPARARLLLRVRRERVPALQAMVGADLPVAGAVLRLGATQVRELQPLATLYAYRVAADTPDEEAFMHAVARELEALDIAGQRVCGLHQELRHGAHVQHAYSLMLHGLDEAQSLRVQRQGLGGHRLLGCGIFVPHKSAAAV